MKAATSALFLEFSTLCERLSLTPSKAEKVSLLSSYFRALSSGDLGIAVDFLLGRASRAGGPEGRANVAFATVRDALSQLVTFSDDRLLQLYREHGDLGEVAAELLSSGHATALVGERLTLKRVRDCMDEISTAQGAGSERRKAMALVGLLLDASPLEAKYLIKILTSDMRIGVSEGLVAEAIAEAFSAPLGAVRKAYLVVNDMSRVAMIAKEGRLSNASFSLFTPIRPMLAEPASSARQIIDDMGKCIVEDKYDGIRLQVHKKGEDVRLYSRAMEDVTRFFPEVVEQISQVSGDFALDGELIYEGGGKLRFFSLQKLLRNEGRREKHPLKFVAFDVLYANGRPLLDLPLVERKRELLALGYDGCAPFREASTPEEVERAFSESIARGNEGIVAKDPGSAYEPGARGKRWMKLKKVFDTLDVVVIGAQYGNGKRKGLLSDYIFAVRRSKDDPALVPIGKAYSGLTDEELRGYHEFFTKNKIGEEGNTVWVLPKLVIEVGFQSIQKSARYESGYALRFPRIISVRTDKKPDEIDDLEKVKELFSAQG